MEISYETCMPYVCGESKLDEARTVRAWLAAPANELLAQYWMSEHVAQAPAPPKPATVEPFNYAAMRENLHARLGLDLDVVPVVQTNIWHRWASPAAVAGVVAGSGWVLSQQMKMAEPTTFAPTMPYGQTRVVKLPDGSEVTLNAQRPPHGDDAH